jgi:hypothetical protein
MGWQAMTFVFITLFLPDPLLIAGIILSLTGMVVAIAGVLRGRSAWAQFSILEIWFAFFVLIISQALTNTIAQYLSITLLQCVMIFFAFELSSVCCDLRQQLSNEISAGDNLLGMEGRLHRSTQAAFRTISRAGLLFASCYVVSMTVLYVSTSVAFVAPVITDISLYVVVVSVSLALLLLSRED